MDIGSLLYLCVTLGLFVIFAIIVYRTYKPSNRAKTEIAKYNMMDDDQDDKS